MSEFTLDDLPAILRQSTGDQDGTDLGAEVSGLTFAYLGHDSLAVQEVAARIEQRYHVPVPDESST